MQPFSSTNPDQTSVWPTSFPPDSAGSGTGSALAVFVADGRPGDMGLGSLLERILVSAAQLLGCGMGSICTIDETAQVYRKEVDLGAECRVGQVFSLDEGVTGAVVRAGGAVVFTEYSQVPGGHLGQDDARYQRSVIGVPIRFESRLIGACVVFANSAERLFTGRDAQLLEVFATQAARAIADFRQHTVAIELSISVTELHQTERAALAHDFGLSGGEHQHGSRGTVRDQQHESAHHRVLVLHPQPLTRAGLVHLLAHEGTGIDVVAEVDDASGALAAATYLHPDVVVTDIELLDLPGTNLIEALAQSSPGTAVVLLVGDPDDERIRRAARAGARGFLERSADGHALVRAVSSAAAGDAVLSGVLVDRWGAAPPDPDHLTLREREVRGLVERGLRDKQIGIELGISAKTVENHVGTILKKTGAANRTMLAGLAHAR
ncbi:GAF domain-containing protein [Cryobacterium sp. CG_9.6]|uniref:GAF domain-containing protein n=1 Tax=Cryobacterium sp. CG_9.6 TaxID=2760710 RepID=UPI0024759E36|nr:GAF domain-containing protein [Cryobacterium sp. CG_9.6]MDH6235500.1 DNA-binding NarL/FixJ family response regulator [Cryobacterium sp. CG_9.6]